MSVNANLISPYLPSLTEQLTEIPKELILIIDSYLSEDVTSLFLQTLMVDYVKDPNQREEIRARATLYGKGVTTIDLRQATVGYYHNETAPRSPQLDPNTWFSKQLNQAFRIFSSVQKFVVPYSVRVVHVDEAMCFKPPQYVKFSNIQQPGVAIDVPSVNREGASLLPTEAEGPTYQASITMNHTPCVLVKRVVFDEHNPNGRYPVTVLFTSVAFAAARLFAAMDQNGPDGPNGRALATPLAL